MRSFEEVAAFLRQHEVGRRAYIEAPYGRRLICYGDLTATGRYLHFVEAWIRRVRPYYANSHTAISTTGRIMTELREEARRVVRRSVNASKDDLVLFVGSGATAAVNKLVGLLGLRVDEPLERAYGLSRAIPAGERPIVLCGPYEHHSNELPWLESVADVVETALDATGRPCLEDLAKKLVEYKDRPLRLGAFSAASNVTGVLSDVRGIARTLHAHGAYAFFDYAAAGPYAPIDMNPADPLERADAIFLSTHKFLGGPEGSGVLAARRELVRTRVPERPGGGTVDYVGGSSHAAVDYTKNLEEREEGGTPDILGDLRAGIGFLVKEMVGPERILEHERALAARAIARLRQHPRIRLLGPLDVPRLAILSFNVEGLHHDFVSGLLDHLFGIQNRAGCSCAGPYGHRLLGIGTDRSELYRAQIARGVLGIKPGWVRLTLPYYASAADLEYVLSALEFVADHGEAFLEEYELSWRDGVWRNTEHAPRDARPIELTVEALEEAAACFAAGDHEQPMSEAQIAAERARYFAEARAHVARLEASAVGRPAKAPPPSTLPGVDELVWFRYRHARA